MVSGFFLRAEVGGVVVFFGSVEDLRPDQPANGAGGGLYLGFNRGEVVGPEIGSDKTLQFGGPFVVLVENHILIVSGSVLWGDLLLGHEVLVIESELQIGVREIELYSLVDRVQNDHFGDRHVGKFINLVSV